VADWSEGWRVVLSACSCNAKKTRKLRVLGRLSNGERIAGISAILLFVFMFFHWFDVKARNTSNLLFLVGGGGHGKSVWGSLDYIPIVLVIAIVAAFAVIVLRLATPVHKPPIPVNAVSQCSALSLRC
jgi:hypothetical protein